MESKDSRPGNLTFEEPYTQFVDFASNENMCRLKLNVHNASLALKRAEDAEMEMPELHSWILGYSCRLETSQE